MNKYVVLSSLVAGLLTWLFMYIDARLFDTPKTKFTYFKGISFVSALVAGIVYFLAPSTITVQSGGEIPSPMGTVLGGGSDMITGMPPF